MATLEEVFGGEVALVTGAGSGLGREIARRIAHLGGRVMLADVDAARVEATRAMLDNAPGEVEATVLDVRDADAVRAAVDATVERFGGLRHVFSNAGVGVGGSPGEMDMRDWRWIVDINLLGVVNGVEAALPHLKANAPAADGLRGHIVNTASLAGHMALSGLGPYHATKFAVVGLSESLRQELMFSKIGVTALCPSFVKTDIHNTANNSPSARERGGLALDDPKYLAGKAAVDNGQELETYIELALRAVASNRMHSFNDPLAGTAFEMRKGMLDADLAAALEDLAEMEAGAERT